MFHVGREVRDSFNLQAAPWGSDQARSPTSAAATVLTVIRKGAPRQAGAGPGQLRREPQRFMVQILGPSDQAVGLGFIAGERHLLTCAHVVNVALGRGQREIKDPGAQWLSVEFPFAGGPGSESCDGPRWPPGCLIQILALDAP